MRALLFAILLLGQLFVIRTQKKFAERALISANTLTKIGTAILATTFLLSFSLTPTLATLICGATLLSYALILSRLEERKLNRLRDSIPSFMDYWILNLRLGLAEFHAREKALKTMSPDFAKIMQTFFLGADHSAEQIFSDTLLMKELKSITQTPHSALPRLENLRDDLKKCSEFRRKSGQAVRQTRIQSTLMMLLLIALSFLALKRYGWAKVGDLIGISASLGLFGVVLIQSFARKRQWKV